MVKSGNDGKWQLAGWLSVESLCNSVSFPFECVPMIKNVRFGLRGLLLFVALVACASYLLTPTIQSALRKAAYQQMQQQGATFYTSEITTFPRPIAGPQDGVDTIALGPGSTAETTERLRYFPEVHELSLTGVQGDLSDRVESISTLQNLEVLRMTNCSNVQPILKQTKQLPNLRMLVLTNCALTSEMTTEIGEHRHLEVLDLQGSSVSLSAEASASLGNLTELATVNFTDVIGLNDSIGPILSKWSKLRVLTLNGTGVTNVTIRELSKLPKLESLRMNRTSIDDEAVADLLDCRHLTHIELEGTKVTEAGIVRLAAHPNLNTIQIDLPITETRFHELNRQFVLNRGSLFSLLHPAYERLPTQEYRTAPP